MFDGNTNSFFHSKTSDGGGVKISFMQNIVFGKLEINTRKGCCYQRYQNVCLYGDQAKLVCIKRSKVNPGELLVFKTTPTVFNSLRLEWNGKNQHSQISELAVYYRRPLG